MALSAAQSGLRAFTIAILASRWSVLFLLALFVAHLLQLLSDLDRDVAKEMQWVTALLFLFLASLAAFWWQAATPAHRDKHMKLVNEGD